MGRIVGHGDKPTQGQMPFTPRAKTVVELSLREALSLGHKHVGIEHILLSLARENSGVAARIPYDLDASAQTIVSATLTQLGTSPEVADEVALKSFAAEPFPSPAGERRVSVTIGSGRFWLTPFFMATVVPLLAAAALLGIGILIGWLIWG